MPASHYGSAVTLIGPVLSRFGGHFFLPGVASLLGGVIGLIFQPPRPSWLILSAGVILFVISCFGLGSFDVRVASVPVA
ncbi:MAG: hypothetical protein ACI835_004911 [Planctomycetota bacterium]|jgi:hypothetical protein